MADKGPIVTLITDFGTTDGYAGVVKGVLLSLAANLMIVDITHDVEPWNIRAAAWIAANTYKYFPAGTVHLAVVDPGVGTARRPIAVVSDAGTFVGPDNGIFTAAAASEKALAAYELTEKEFWLKPLSATFHARDIFAPVAARLATGTPAHRLGTRIDAETLVKLPSPQIVCGQDWVEGEIVHVDRFGNLISNIPVSATAAGATCLVNGQRIGALTSTYGSTSGGQPAVVPGSHGFVEIGVTEGSATSALHAGVGSAVRMESG